MAQVLSSQSNVKITYISEIVLELFRERRNRALVILLYKSRRFLRARNAFKNSVFEASKLVSTKTLLLKH